MSDTVHEKQGEEVLMDSINAGDPGPRSADIVAENLEHLKTLFPEAFAEGKVDFDVLKQLLGAAANETEEKYGLHWHGKRYARQFALMPSTGTLRPCPEESVDWDTTQNLMLEGDNLEVLKLLQKSYAGKVKLIYIDPPYNTGNDFVYQDNYRDSLENYLEISGQVDGKNQRLSSNKETSGRFHTDWLNMIYPRLKLARNLLRSNGVIFISIDEHEVAELRKVCDELFGEECFVAALTVLCNPKGRSQDKYFATNHEYVICYSKQVLPKGYFSVAKETSQILNEYREEDERGKYRLLELRNTHREFGRFNRSNLYYPFFVDKTGCVHLEDSDDRFQVLPIWNDGFEGCWTWGKSKAKKEISLLVAREVRGRWKIYRKSYANGVQRMIKTILSDKAFYTERGQDEFNDLFETKDKIFQSPKSPHLLAQLFRTVTYGEDIVADFFAGSGTTGHAINQLNASDGGNRRYILVQLPEPFSEENPDHIAAVNFCHRLNKPQNVAELTKERLRRVAKRMRKENTEFVADLGFRVFKLDTSNFRAWESTHEDLESALLDSVDHINPNRSEQDVLYELLLKVGLDLCVPIETRTVSGKSVHSVGAGTLITCLAETITLEEVEPLALGIADWHDELATAGLSMIYFRDSAFADDVAKTNLAGILEQRGVGNVRSI